MGKSRLLMAYDDGYRVDDLGVVRSPSGRVLRLYVNTSGYLEFSARFSGMHRSKSLAVHRLLAYQKYGSKMLEPRIEVRHQNGKNTDNSWDNILIGSKSDNEMDKAVEVRLSSARSAARALRKLSEQEAETLKQDRKAGMTYKQLSEKYGIVKSTISYIIHSKTYNHNRA